MTLFIDLGVPIAQTKGNCMIKAQGGPWTSIVRHSDPVPTAPDGSEDACPRCFCSAESPLRSACLGRLLAWIRAGGFDFRPVIGQSGQRSRHGVGKFETPLRCEPSRAGFAPRNPVAILPQTGTFP
jgi:hypothetical protein